jgi:hypothetical protein
MKPEHHSFVLTANRTIDGAVVYADAAGAWVASLAAAAVFTDRDQAAPLLASARAAERTICDPYLMPVVADGGATAAANTRERIRAAGPTTRLRRPDAPEAPPGEA